ncbi:MAG: TrmH family RNA methyltransferase [Planctomycetota bacterium]
MIERIESLDDPRLNVFRSLKTTNTIRDARIFIAEGQTLVERILRSHFEVRSLLITDRRFPNFESKLPANVPVFRLANDLAEELIGFSFHAGVMACVSRRPAPSIESFVSGCGPCLIVAGDRIANPENVGALIRIAAAFGASAVIFGDGSVDPFSRRVLRVSMGNALHTPVLEVQSLPLLLRRLIDEFDFEVCGTVLNESAKPLARHLFRDRTVLLFGNEFDGLGDDCRLSCNTQLTIPMSSETDSLNVAISAGIFAYQYRSQFA